MAAQDEHGKKQGGKRTKFPMRLISDPKQRHVSFSKRKKGLFRKCAALSSLFSGTGAVEIAAVVVSQCGKVFSFGHSSADAVFHRYQGGDGLDSGERGFWWDNVDIDHLNLIELRQFKSSLEELRNRVIDRVIGASEIASGDSTDDDSISAYDCCSADDLLELQQLGFGPLVHDHHQHCDYYGS